MSGGRGHSVRLATVTLNSADPIRTASFWAQVLGGESVDGGNRFRHVRVAGAFLLIIQHDPGRPVGPSDIHLDLRAEDPAAELARLVGLGAEVVAERSDSSGSWTVLRDVDGREFCLS